jgi:hypothetical protein
VDTSVSEENVASIFRVKFSSSMNLSDYIPNYTTLILTLKVEAAYSSETFVSAYNNVCGFF